MSVVVEGAPPVAPGEPAGRPRVWQAALIALVFAIAAAGSCAEFFEHPLEDPTGRSELLANLFLASVVGGSGALMLVAFRLWRRRERESWPRAGLAAAVAVAGAALAGAGGGGAMLAFGISAARRAPFVIAGFALFVTGLVIAVGAAELFVAGAVRRIAARWRMA